MVTRALRGVAVGYGIAQQVGFFLDNGYGKAEEPSWNINYPAARHGLSITGEPFRIGILITRDNANKTRFLIVIFSKYNILSWRVDL